MIDWHFRESTVCACVCVHVCRESKSDVEEEGREHVEGKTDENVLFPHLSKYARRVPSSALFSPSYFFFPPFLCSVHPCSLKSFLSHPVILQIFLFPLRRSFFFLFLFYNYHFISFSRPSPHLLCFNHYFLHFISLLPSSFFSFLIFCCCLFSFLSIFSDFHFIFLSLSSFFFFAPHLLLTHHFPISLSTSLFWSSSFIFPSSPLLLFSSYYFSSHYLLTFSPSYSLLPFSTCLYSIFPFIFSFCSPFSSPPPPSFSFFLLLSLAPLFSSPLISSPVIITESSVDVEAYIKLLWEEMRSEQPGGENRLSDTLRLTCIMWNKQRLPFCCCSQSDHAEKVWKNPPLDMSLHQICLCDSLLYSIPV